MPKVQHFLLVAIFVTSFVSCGRQPAQDYVVTGTLEFAPAIAAQFTRMRDSGVDFELIMTLRTSPDAADVVVQRRWYRVFAPMEFGLGKGRGEAFKKLHPKVYVTSMLKVRDNPNSFAAVGFTANAVPAGTYHVKLTLDHMLNEDLSRFPGAPRGGFESPSILEEAVPPGLKPQAPGTMAFAGLIDVPERFRQSLKETTLFVIARERPDRAAPELILRYKNPEFPLRFALHQNHRIQGIGSTEPVIDPKHVVVRLDFDGTIETNDDAIIVATAKKAALGTADLKFVLPGHELENLLEPKKTTDKLPQSQPSRQSTPRPPDPREALAKGTLIGSGEVNLDPALVGLYDDANLWLSFRDAASGTALEFVQMAKGKLPRSFELKNGEGMMGVVFAKGQKLVVRAILTKTGPMDENALSGLTAAFEAGTKELKVTLRKP